MATLNGEPLLAGAASRLSHDAAAARIAVVGPGQEARARCSCISAGMSSSIRRRNKDKPLQSPSASSMQAGEAAASVLIMLGDMPSSRTVICGT